ncbi:MAG: hypothetical protein JWP88_1512 [Flaviaesturariibacter sp.]|nr:hypothetical protein [Flaviaesturariibacter sp.]
MEENFSPQDSLHLIQSMIVKTKSNLSENRIYFLLWGWVSFVAILGQFVLKVIVGYDKHYLVWLLTIPTSVLTIIYSARREGQRSVSTYVGESMGSLWTGIGISFFVLSLIITRLPSGWNSAWPFFILFYGLGTFISGRILRFRPLVLGGIFNWMLAVVSIYVAFDYQLLLAAAAILTSYIIPGYLLKSSQN